MAYLGQLDNLVHEADRGKAIRNTQTIAVFGDGLVICAVSVATGGRPVAPWRWWRPARASRPGGRGDGNEVGRIAAELGAGADAAALAQAWPRAELIPAAVIESVVLERPRQVTRLTITEERLRSGEQASSVFLGDISGRTARDLLGPVLGGRLQIDLPAD